MITPFQFLQKKIRTHRYRSALKKVFECMNDPLPLSSHPPMAYHVLYPRLPTEHLLDVPWTSNEFREFFKHDLYLPTEEQVSERRKYATALKISDIRNWSAAHSQVLNDIFPMFDSFNALDFHALSNDKKTFVHQYVAMLTRAIANAPDQYLDSIFVQDSKWQKLIYIFGDYNDIATIIDRQQHPKLHWMQMATVSSANMSFHPHNFLVWLKAYDTQPMFSTYEVLDALKNDPEAMMQKQSISILAQKNRLSWAESLSSEDDFISPSDFHFTFDAGVQYKNGHMDHRDPSSDYQYYRIRINAARELEGLNLRNPVLDKCPGLRFALAAYHLKDVFTTSVAIQSIKMVHASWNVHDELQYFFAGIWGSKHLQLSQDIAKNVSIYSSIFTQQQSVFEYCIDHRLRDVASAYIQHVQGFIEMLRQPSLAYDTSNAVSPLSLELE